MIFEERFCGCGLFLMFSLVTRLFAGLDDGYKRKDRYRTDVPHAAGHSPSVVIDDVICFDAVAAD